jgi:hypothetical protein
MEEVSMTSYPLAAAAGSVVEMNMKHVPVCLSHTSRVLTIIDPSFQVIGSSSYVECVPMVIADQSISTV